MLASKENSAVEINTVPWIRVLDPDPTMAVLRADWIRALGWRCESHTCPKLYLQNYDLEIHGANLVTIDEFRDLEVLLESAKRFGRSTTIALLKNPNTPLASQAQLAGAFAIQDQFAEAEELEETIRLAIQRDQEQRTQSRRHRHLSGIRNALSSSEKKIIELIILGHSNKMIAKHFGMAMRTVEKRRHDIVDKFQASSMAEVIRLVTEVMITERLTAEQSFVA